MTPLNFVPTEFEAHMRSRRASQHGAFPLSPTERKAIRIRAGLTQAEFAEQLGVTSETLGRWERGDGRPGRQAADAYALALQILVQAEP